MGKNRLEAFSDGVIAIIITPDNYVNGANIGCFLKVANSMMDQGLV